MTTANAAPSAIDTATIAKPAKTSTAPKHKGPRKPNYNLIHKDALPITLYTAPPLIPHNPISLLHYLYLYLFPPQVSHTPRYTGSFSATTCSVHVTDPATVLDLWNRGFWGKGSLSRSEPTWLAREQRRVGVKGVNETSEEVTKRRREERKEFKKERAKAEQTRLEKVKKEEAGKEKVGPEESGVVVGLAQEIEAVENAGLAESIFVNGIPLFPVDNQVLANAAEESTTVIVETLSGNLTAAEPPVTAANSTLATVVHTASSNGTVLDPTTEADTSPSASSVKNEEHLQLSLFESFFLSYALGILTITNPASQVLQVSDLIPLFHRYSISPPLPDSTPFTTDSFFLINYAVYHHFRSLGWVVKTGVKFSVDFLLYKRGPVFSHAEFAVVILPCYSAWEGKDGKSEVVRKEWWWLHSIMRVSSQVKKTVVLVYVEVPTLEEVEGWNEKGGMGVKGLLGRYGIREVTLRRWIPNRNRDM